MTMNTTMIDLSKDLGLIAIKGQDAERFLQGQLSCDIREIEAIKPTIGAFCNLKGRIRVLFRIVKIQDGFLLSLPLSLIPYSSQELKKYARFSKVEINDVTHQWSRLGFMSQRKDLLNLLKLNAHPETILLEYPSSNSYCRVEMMGFDAKKENNADLENLNQGTFNDWILEDIRSHLPEIWPETKEIFLSHHLNLPALGAVSFTKGCYCGQEIIARMQYLGNIKRGLHYHLFEDLHSLPTPGSKILDDQTFVVSSALNEKGQVEVLLEKVK